MEQKSLEQTILDLAFCLTVDMGRSHHYDVIDDCERLGAIIESIKSQAIKNADEFEAECRGERDD